MNGMSSVWAWMSRDDVVMTVSITAIVLSLVNVAFTVARERRRG